MAQVYSENHAEKKTYTCSRRFWVKEPRHSETVSDVKRYTSIIVERVPKKQISFCERRVQSPLSEQPQRERKVHVYRQQRPAAKNNSAQETLSLRKA